MKKIQDSPIAFEISKKKYDYLWHTVFAKDKIPYSYDLRDRFWDKLTIEGENTRG